MDGEGEGGMRTVELFSGTKSFSKVMAAHGHSTFTVDNRPELEPRIVADILELDADSLFCIDILWASPPCTAFSVASIGTHWGGGHRAYEPKTEAALLGMKLVQKTRQIIDEAKPTWWFIENPRGVLRKLPIMEGLFRHTITYCQYGDSRMKPTDIWTNAWWWHPRHVCRNGDKCHISAPRGAKTGTQGVEGARDRGRIPPQLFEEILAQMPQPAINEIRSKKQRLNKKSCGQTELKKRFQLEVLDQVFALINQP